MSNCIMHDQKSDLQPSILQLNPEVYTLFQT